MVRERLVLLPGMMCDARLFAPQVEALEGTHDVTVCDLTGADTIEGMARQVLDAVSGPFSLAGLSMGGIVAMAAAAMAPARVQRLALLDTNHRADTAERRGIRDRQSAKVAAGHLRDVIVEEMKPNYLAADSRRRQDLLDLLVAMALALGAEAFLSQTQALKTRADQSAALRSYDRPALVLCGAEDTLCPPERHREMAKLLRRSELMLVPGAGHISTLEAPEAVNTALREWLARPTGEPEITGR